MADSGSASDTILSGGPGIQLPVTQVGGYGGPTVDATGTPIQTSRVMQVDNGSGDLQLINLTIQNGISTYNGGGIQVGSAGVVELIGCVLKKNFADYTGGAMEVSNVGALVLTQTDFSGNISEYEGGAVTASASVIEIERSRFVNNLSDYTAGALLLKADNGIIDIIKSDFRGNSSGYEAGAINMSASGGWIQVEGARFMMNQANYSGGAVMVNNTPTVDFVDVLLARNTAGYEHSALQFGGSGVDSAVVMQGGAVWANDDNAGAIGVGSDWKATMLDVDFGMGQKDNTIDVEGCSQNFGANSSFLYDDSQGIYCQ
jgi:hypothetical protein